MSYKLAIVGSHKFQDYKKLCEIMEKTLKPSVVITEGTKGVGELAGIWASEKEIPVQVVEPNWRPNGPDGEFDKGAGFKANIEVASSCDALLAFFDCESRGTMHVITTALNKNKYVRIIYTSIPSKKEQRSEIKGFKDNDRWLSNFWPCEITYKGVSFQSVESAYQAAKFASNKDVFLKFSGMTAMDAKKRSKDYIVDSGFFDNRISVMKELLVKKFSGNISLQKKLILTGEAYLEETNTWNDIFWGVCDGQGQNVLGRLLMEVREELIQKEEKEKQEFKYE